MDFINDQLSDICGFMIFNVIDDYNREGLSIKVDFSLSSAQIIRALGRIIEWLGSPCTIRCNNGPDYVRELLVEWAKKRCIGLKLSNSANHRTKLQKKTSAMF